jgi:hypothetical protein
MRSMLAFFSLFLVFESYAQSIELPHYGYSIENVRERAVQKEELFERMRRLRVKQNDSICSNRAHVWAYDFHKIGIKASKIFLFFTPKTGQFEGLSWWYHVAPVINEDGKLWVLDGGFPDRVKGPLLVEKWLKEFNGIKSTCKEITSEDADLIKFIFRERAFPEVTEYGRHDCYYHLTPPSYWIPSQIAKNVLGIDEEGRPVRFERDEFQKAEVLKACREATTTPLSWMIGKNTSFCRKFLEEDQNLTSVY